MIHDNEFGLSIRQHAHPQPSYHRSHIGPAGLWRCVCEITTLVTGDALAGRLAIGLPAHQVRVRCSSALAPVDDHLSAQLLFCVPVFEPLRVAANSLLDFLDPGRTCHRPQTLAAEWVGSPPRPPFPSHYRRVAASLLSNASVWSRLPERQCLAGRKTSHTRWAAAAGGRQQT